MLFFGRYNPPFLRCLITSRCSTNIFLVYSTIFEKIFYCVWSKEPGPIIHESAWPARFLFSELEIVKTAEIKQFEIFLGYPSRRLPFDDIFYHSEAELRALGFGHGSCQCILAHLLTSCLCKKLQGAIVHSRLSCCGSTYDCRPMHIAQWWKSKKIIEIKYTGTSWIT